MRRRRVVTSVLAAAMMLPLAAQERGQQTAGDSERLSDSLAYRVETQATVGGGEHSALWLNANRYGLSSVDANYGYVRGAVERPLRADDGRRWGVGYGVDMAVAAGMTSTAVVQQAYVEGRWLKAVLSLGAKERPMELKNQELSSGAQTLGINARPVPQLRFELAEYWSIPYTKGWLGFRGHGSYGMTTDDGWQKEFTDSRARYTERTWMHTKAGFLRIGPKNITLEVGLEVACQFGGRSYRVAGSADEAVYENGSGMKAFWNALLPTTGQDATDNVYSNAEGNHLGSWLLRLNMDYATWNLGLYADHFFEDQSSMVHVSHTGYGTGEAWNELTGRRYYLYDFKDWLLGAELKLKDGRWLNTVVLEYLYTKYQGGPLYHDHTPAISEHICGRDNFYNHNLYTGWQHWGMVMGNPLYRSPLYNDDGTIRVENNRFTAWHLGLSGSPAERLHYRLLATWQRGYGTYSQLFQDPKENVSLMGEASYRLSGGWQVKAAVGMDRGGVYGDNAGCQLTVTKTGLIK